MQSGMVVFINLCSQQYQVSKKYLRPNIITIFHAETPFRSGLELLEQQFSFPYTQGFFSGGGGPPPCGKFCQSPPSDTCPRVLDQGLSPPAEVRPQKFEKFKYIFVSNLTTFKLKSTLTNCISCLK